MKNKINKSFPFNILVSIFFFCFLFFPLKVNAGAGTPYLIKDISLSGDAEPIALKVINGVLYFSAYSDDFATELWKTDGTEAGTVMVKDINPDGDSFPGPFFELGESFYFPADDGINGRELWKSDGTDAGTSMLKDINLGGDSSPTAFIIYNDELFFIATDTLASWDLWKTDGTEAGTVMVKDIDSYIEYQTIFNGELFFKAGDPVHGYELWKTDGTDAGTVMVKDINPGISNSWPINMTAVGSEMYFRASDGVNGYELWKTDGTEAGTVMVKDINLSGDSYPRDFIEYNNFVYFEARDGINGTALWKTDGTDAGTVMVRVGTAAEFIIYDDYLFFESDDGVNGYELWKTDGTEAGTVMVKDINEGVLSSYPQNKILFDNKFYFTADDGVHGYEIWKSDGTEAGTVIVDDLNPLDGSSPEELTLFNNKLYFGADNGTLGYELYAIQITYGLVDSPSFGSNDGLTSNTDNSNQTSNSSNDNNNSNTNGSILGIANYDCYQEKPSNAPNLFQIDVTDKTAKLYFTPIGNTNDFYISFSENESAEKHGELVSLLKEGVQSHTVYYLKPNTTYYFKVRGQKGCMPGDWSNILSFRTQPSANNLKQMIYQNTIGRTNKFQIAKTVDVTEEKTETKQNVTDGVKSVEYNSRPANQVEKDVKIDENLHKKSYNDGQSQKNQQNIWQRIVNLFRK